MPTAKKAPATKTVIKRAPPKVPAAPQGPLGAKGRYHIHMEVNGEEFDGNTDHIAKSLSELKPDRLSTKLLLRFSLAGSDTGKRVEHVLMIPRARRLFSNRMAMELIEKSALMGLGDYHV